MRGVHDTEMPASTTALSWPSDGPRKVADGPEISANPAVTGRDEYLNSCSQVALRNGSNMNRSYPPLVRRPESDIAANRLFRIPLDTNTKTYNDHDAIE